LLQAKLVGIENLLCHVGSRKDSTVVIECPEGLIHRSDKNVYE
jgi:hypothetical protein